MAVLHSGRGISVRWIIIICESRATKIDEIYKTNMSG